MNITPEWLTAIATLVLVIATCIYVYFSYKLTEETVKLRELETTPFVTVYIQPFKHSNLLELVIKNIGKSPAYDLHINYDENIKAEWLKYEMSLPELNLNYFSVEQTLNYFIGRFNKDLKPLPIILSYSSKDKKLIKETIVFNIDFGNLDVSAPYEIEQLNKNFDKLIKVIENIK